ncbi:MAG: TPM domain-containing protein, partial [Myxococcota bacterium]
MTDLAGVLEPLDEVLINQRLTELEQANGAQVALVTVGSVEEYDPKRFVTELFQRWGVGVTGADNGVLVLFSLGDRRI